MDTASTKKVAAAVSADITAMTYIDGVLDLPGVIPRRRFETR